MTARTQSGQSGRLTRPRPSGPLARLAGPWWMFLVTGVAWLIISVAVLRFSIASVATIGVLIGVPMCG
jgi:uncharacterized membrane protein HdeD (DUF308 family)